MPWHCLGRLDKEIQQEEVTGLDRVQEGTGKQWGMGTCGVDRRPCARREIGGQAGRQESGTSTSMDSKGLKLGLAREGD